MSYDQGRPSLFAGMEVSDAKVSDNQRVRILSTLASSRGVQRPPHKGPRNGRFLINGWTIALGMGLATLLASFVLIIKEQHPEAIKAPLAPALEQAPSPARDLADITPVASVPSIEAPAPETATVLPFAPPVAEPKVAAISQPAPPAKLKPTAGKPAKGTTTQRRDQDVELIEAVMIHANKRPGSH